MFFFLVFIFNNRGLSILLRTMWVTTEEMKLAFKGEFSEKQDGGMSNDCFLSFNFIIGLLATCPNLFPITMVKTMTKILREVEIGSEAEALEECTYSLA